MLVGAATFAGLASAQTAANALFDDTQVQVIDVTMVPSDWAALQQNYLLDTYYHASMIWNGASVTFGIRSHGDGSRSPIKPDLDFNFGHYTTGQTFLGLEFVMMKANNEDPSNLREWISMKLYRAMGLPAPREAPAQLFMNGQLLGLYYIVEHEDDQKGNFLQRNFGENGGYLYEWQWGESYEFGNLGADPNSYAAFLKLKSNQAAPDLQTFANFIQAVNAPTSPEAGYISGLSAYMNPSLFLSYCATENVLAESDGVLGGYVGANNFYLYQFQNSTLYQMIAWDKDNTFSDPLRPITYGVTEGATITEGGVTGSNINVLAQTLYGFPDYQEVYLGELTRAATLLGGAGGWADSEIAREWGVISPAALNDPNKQCVIGASAPAPCGTADTLAALQAIHSFLAQRSAFVLSSAIGAGYQPASSNPEIQSVTLYPPATSVTQVSPGALSQVGGSDLGPAGQAALVTTAGAALPRVIGSTFVAVEGVRAPLVLTNPGYIGFQVPEDQAAGIEAHVVVSIGGTMSNSASVSVSPTSPAILAVIRANGSAVAAGNAPVPGEIVSVYAIGLGAVAPDVALGAPPPSGTFATTVTTPTATLGGSPMNVWFSGLASDFAGLYQVNVQMPATPPAGVSAQMTLTDGAATSVFQVPLQ
jgi:uncharacterized protein (TIGR03437 family)